ncbi:hypothetical protein ACWDRR_02475 [Kitasatospora sp. NPDC003701]
MLRGTVDGRGLVTGALGEPVTGVPAGPDGHVRAGPVGSTHPGTVLLRLVGEQQVGRGGPLARRLPEVPHADRTTLRGLGDSPPASRTR